jgi:hypothetical protein
MRMRHVLSLALICLAAVPAIASAGGWATVGLNSTPDGTAPGEPWRVNVEVLQHGQTPLAGVVPKIRIRESGGASRTFTARPTGRTGIYTATVVFPTAGTWTYEVDDGFSQRHSFAPVEIAAATTTAAATADSDDGFPWTALGAALLVGVIAAGLTVLFTRRRDRGAPQQAMPADG